MKNWQIIIAACVLGMGSTAWGSGARQYCEEMYPVESYEADERRQYIEECVAVTDDSESFGSEEYSAGSEEYSETETPEENYYDGTVEDYVNSVSDEEPVQ